MQSFKFLQKLGCYKPNPLKMNLALEIRIGLQKDVGVLLEDHPPIPKLLLLRYGGSTGPYKI